jgi:hypothetical protein
MTRVMGDSTMAKSSGAATDDQAPVREKGVAGAENIGGRGLNVLGRSVGSTIENSAGVEITGVGEPAIMLVATKVENLAVTIVGWDQRRVDGQYFGINQLFPRHSFFFLSLH